MSRKRKAQSLAESSKADPDIRRTGKKSKKDEKASKEEAGDGLRPQPGSSRRPDPRDELLEEIKALGGDEHDYDLIKDVDSDDDEAALVAALPVENGLRKEIARLITDLGLENHHDSTVAPADVAEEDTAGDLVPEPQEVAPSGKKRRLVCEPGYPTLHRHSLMGNVPHCLDPRSATRLAHRYPDLHPGGSD